MFVVRVHVCCSLLLLLFLLFDVVLVRVSGIVRWSCSPFVVIVIVRVLVDVHVRILCSCY